MTGSAAQEGADALQCVARLLLSRDKEYRGSDTMLARVMSELHPEGLALNTIEDYHRFHIWMLMIVKVTRYAKNWEKGHEDSLRDLAAYSGMLIAIDRDDESGEEIGS
jgi:hypothetical protein